MLTTGQGPADGYDPRSFRLEAYKTGNFQKFSSDGQTDDFDNMSYTHGSKCRSLTNRVVVSVEVEKYSEFENPLP